MTGFTTLLYFFWCSVSSLDFRVPPQVKIFSVKNTHYKSYQWQVIIYCNVSQKKDLVVTDCSVSSGSLVVHAQFCLYFSSLSYILFPPLWGLKQYLIKPDLPLLSSSVSLGSTTSGVLHWLIICETGNRRTGILYSICVLGTFLSR